MHRELIDRLLAEVPMLQFHRINEEKMANGVWFIFEVRPIPPLEQLQMVIADIDRDIGTYLLKNGMLTHSNECNKQSHELDSKLRAAVKRIESQTFRIAVWEGNGIILNGQPVVISLEPEISYNVYPDHPHLNAGYKGQDYYIPDSLCYTDQPKELGDEPYTRTLEAIQQACIWLFKHQMWLASRKIGKGIWIGPGVCAREEEQFYYMRNPYGKCRCGSNELYYQCHLDQDFRNACKFETMIMKQEYKFSIYKNSDGSINLEEYNKWWTCNRFMPQNSTLNRLRKVLFS